MATGPRDTGSNGDDWTTSAHPRWTVHGLGSPGTSAQQTRPARRARHTVRLQSAGRRETGSIPPRHPAGDLRVGHRRNRRALSTPVWGKMRRTWGLWRSLPRTAGSPYADEPSARAYRRQPNPKPAGPQPDEPRARPRRRGLVGAAGAETVRSTSAEPHFGHGAVSPKCCTSSSKAWPQARQRKAYVGMHGLRTETRADP